MDLGAVLFVVALFVPGLFLVFIIGREFKRREWFTHERRIEQELAARRSALRRIARRPAARPTVEPLAYESGSAAAPVRADEADQDSRSAQGDSWQDLTASHIGAAFESFLSAIPEPRPNVITTSQVDEAFEKFMGEM